MTDPLAENRRIDTVIFIRSHFSRQCHISVFEGVLKRFALYCDKSLIFRLYCRIQLLREKLQNRESDSSLDEEEEDEEEDEELVDYERDAPFPMVRLYYGERETMKKKCGII